MSFLIMSLISLLPSICHRWRLWLCLKTRLTWMYSIFMEVNPQLKTFQKGRCGTAARCPLVLAGKRGNRRTCGADPRRRRHTSLFAYIFSAPPTPCASPVQHKAYYPQWNTWPLLLKKTPGDSVYKRLPNAAALMAHQEIALGMDVPCVRKLGNSVFFFIQECVLDSEPRRRRPGGILT